MAGKHRRQVEDEPARIVILDQAVDTTTDKRQKKIDYQAIVDDIFSISRGYLVMD